MGEVRIRLRADGPYVIEGPITLVDHLGNAFTLPTNKRNVALCRCGRSASRPFCDGTHKECGFQAQELAQPAASTQPSPPTNVAPSSGQSPAAPSDRAAD